MCDGATATPSRARRGVSPRDSASTRGAQGGVGRQGEVEALADPVGVEPDEPALGIEQRAAGRSGRERRGVLDAAVDPTAARAAELARDRGHEPERDPRAATVARPGAEDRGADRKRIAVAPVERRRAPGSTSMTARSPSPSKPATLPMTRRPSAKVTVTWSPRRLWALVRTLPGREDDAGAARAAADPDDGWTGPLGDAADGGLKLFDGAHGGSVLLRCSWRAIDLQLAIYY